MRALIIGAEGMVGRKLVRSILTGGRLGDSHINALDLVDVVPPARLESGQCAGIAITARQVDLTAPGVPAELIANRPDIIVMLAAIVSGEAETDYEKGYALNLDATRALFEAVRAEGASGGYRPRVIFSSSIAVFGAPFPEKIGDEFFTTPLTSYGTQKRIGELLLSDMSRKGFLDGIAIRLPTICIRPGKPNLAASGFFSNILREPLSGKPAVLPVGEEVRHWHASPRSAVGFVHHAAKLDLDQLGARRALTMPGLSATVGEQIEALERAAGPKAVALIERKPDPAIAKIVAGWPRDFVADRATALGFVSETSFDQIIAAHVEDELGGRIPVADG